MPARLPAKLAERGLNRDHARAINELREVVKRQQLVARPGQRVVETENGTTLETGTTQNQAPADDGFFY
ncbi:MAG: hypothetical protein EBR82_46480 [Caulobacteraceae bacterium]|nr:hypothetical protein [Caulobacteraceae bacterium]